MTALQDVQDRARIRQPRFPSLTERKACGNRKKPGIYTRLASYVTWIDGVMAEGAAA